MDLVVGIIALITAVIGLVNSIVARRRIREIEISVLGPNTASSDQGGTTIQVATGSIVGRDVRPQINARSGSGEGRSD